MLKSIAKRLLSYTPYRLVKTGHNNRFSAIDDALQSMRQRGYMLKLVLDGGANVGEFSALVHRIWPTALIHAVEPQPGCISFLDQQARNSCLRVHNVALARQPGGTLTMAASNASISTGAHILLSPPTDGSSETVTVPVSTIDQLLAGDVKKGDRALLKLDLQGFELEALKGAVASLPFVEVILTEISFFSQAYEPPIEELVGFLYGHGFRLYDIASLSARRRDNRAHQGDLVFVAIWSELLKDSAWS